MKILKLILFLNVFIFGWSHQVLAFENKTTSQKIEIYDQKIKSIQKEWQENILKSNGVWSAPWVFDIDSRFKEFYQGTFWTHSDEQELIRQHKDIVSKARNKAQQESKKIGVDLDLIRTKKQESLFCSDLPKGGLLHVHPWGTLDLETLKLILSKQNPLIDLAQLKKLGETGLDENSDGQVDSTLPKVLTQNFLNQALVNPKQEANKIRYSNLTEDEKKSFHELFFIKQKTSNFTEFMGVFSVIFNTIFKKDALSDFKFKVDEAMWTALLERAQKEKISYIEVTQTVNSKNGIDKYISLKKNLKEKYGITVNSIAALDRRQSPSVIYSQVQDVLSLPASDAVVGINLVANEDLFPALLFKEAYALLAQKRKTTHPQLKATIHAGETGDVLNLRNALAMDVQRIGHGVLLKKDILSLEYVRLNQIPIEANVLSNVLLNVVSSVEEHPFLYDHRLGIPVSLSTDDEGIFQSSLSQECAAIIQKTDIQYTELKEMILNSIRNSFAVETEKKQLLSQLDEDLKSFEKKYSELKSK